VSNYDPNGCDGCWRSPQRLLERSESSLELPTRLLETAKTVSGTGRAMTRT
jgi:hypothetical protein